jgi:flagellar protein FliS
MLFDRLVLDVQRGLEAQRRGDVEDTHKHLTHAQDILLELATSLRPEEFKGGYDLAALYSFLHRQLVMANIRKDASITDEVLTLVTDLCETWRQAALQCANEQSA